MRKVNFKVRNVGSEKYLSYVINEDLDFDEELLDYLDDNRISELIDIIYEEDDENDYFTYNITDRTTVGELLENTASAEMMLGIIRGVATGIVNMRDLGIPVSYVILNKNFTYVNPVTYDIKLLCIPIETDISLNAEFKMFVKDLIFSAKYPDNEDCNYVAKIINMLNADKFTIRAFLGELTELMEAAGMQVEEEFMDVGDSGVEVSQSVEAPKSETTMDDLPEFNDISFSDEEEDALELYDEEPVAENTIFKDLDLDADEGAVSSVNMDAFDESKLDLDELQIDEESKPEETEDTEISSSEDDTDDNDEIKVEVKENAEGDAGLEESDEEDDEDIKIEGLDTEATDDAEPEKQSDEHSVHIVENDDLTEIIPDDMEVKPVLIDTEDLDKLIDKPPVVKNIRINRAKIIQSAADEAEDDTMDNPTEQIIGTDPVKLDEPDTAPAADTEEASSDATVELTEGAKITKEDEHKEESASHAGPKAMPYIVRVDTEERVMVNKSVFKLGKATRGVDFTISGNGAVSKIHAIIYQREDGCYIKDNKAANPTYVDGVKLEENQEIKLKNNSTIVIGGEDFLFKLS